MILFLPTRKKRLPAQSTDDNSRLFHLFAVLINWHWILLQFNSLIVHANLRIQFLCTLFGLQFLEIFIRNFHLIATAGIVLNALSSRLAIVSFFDKRCRLILHSYEMYSWFAAIRYFFWAFEILFSFNTTDDAEILFSIKKKCKFHEKNGSTLCSFINELIVVATPQPFPFTACTLPDWRINKSKRYSFFSQLIFSVVFLFIYFCFSMCTQYIIIIGHINSNIKYSKIVFAM